MNKVAKKKILILIGLGLFLLVMIILVSILPKRLVLRQRATGTGQVQVFFRAEEGESMAVGATKKISIKVKNSGSSSLTFYTFDTVVRFETDHFTIAPSSVRCLNMETVRRSVGVGSTAATIGSVKLTCASEIVGDQPTGVTLAAAGADGAEKKIGEFIIQATAVGTSPLSFVSPTIPDGSGGNLADAGTSKTITITSVVPTPTPPLVCVDGCYQARPESLVNCNNNCQSKTGHNCILIEEVGLCAWAPAYRCCYRGPTVTPGGPTNTPRPTATPGGPTSTPTVVPTVTPGGPTLTPTPTGTPPPGGWPVLNFKVKFQGVASKRANQKVVVIADCVIGNGHRRDTHRNVNVTADDNGIYSGSVTLDGVESGSKCKFFIKGPKHLSRKFCENNQSARCVGSGKIVLVSGANTFDFSKIVLEAGDLPNPNEGGKQDGVSNSTDYSLWKARIGKEDSDSLTVADVNFDGIVNQIDWQLMRVTLETKYEEEE